ncbi:MAG: hypothetical protein AB7D28_06325 [Candidatus Berkiella sp.]
MKKSLLCAALLSSLIVTACNKTEEIVGDEQSSTGMEYGADSNVTTVPELKPTEQPSAEQTAPTTEAPAEDKPAEEGSAAPQSQNEDATKSQEMIDSMKNTVQEMSDGVADTVDTIKKGAEETAKDIGESLESAKEKAATEAAPMKEEIDQKLEELKKNEKSDSELNL